MPQLDFDKLPQMHPTDVEGLINDMDQDEVLSMINLGRQRALSDPDREVPEAETRASLLLVRRLRGMRENSRSKTRAAKPKAEPISLSGLLASLE